MKNFASILPRWLPAVFMMLAIFWFSSRPGDSLPSFLAWDYVVKKSSHAVGYGLLALSYLHFFNYNKKYYWLAWLAAVLYAMTDELHQAYVPGRHPSIYDALIFDNIGAAVSLWFNFTFRKRKIK